MMHRQLLRFIAIWALLNAGLLPAWALDENQSVNKDDISFQQDAGLAKEHDKYAKGNEEPVKEDEPKKSENNNVKKDSDDTISSPEQLTESPSQPEDTHPHVHWVEDPGEPVLSAPSVSESTLEEQPQGPKYGLERIEIQGNRKTKRQVIVRNIEIKAGEVFSANDQRLEKARYRILASGLFYDVEFSLKRGSRRGWAILVIKVKERNTIVVQDIVVGFSEIAKIYGSLDIAELSLLGTGKVISAAAVVSAKQWGYRLRYSDNHFLKSDFGLHVEGLYNHARDFFGHDKICFLDNCPDVGKPNYKDYAEMNYDRAGFRLGTGYTLLRDIFFSLDYRFEVVSADVPSFGSHLSFDMRQPIVYGHLLPGHSFLSSLVLGVLHDTRDSFTLASEGSRTAFEVELSSEVIGSSYDFSKFVLSHDTHFPLGKGHSIKLGVFLGLIMGDAPFFNQFFVGDFSAFVPSRVLEMNFSHLQPHLLETSIVEMRYEDMAVSLGVEYSLPFYRGQGFFYGINGFIGLGIFALASGDDLKTDPKGYQGYEVIPMDLTADIGIKVDTEIGMFVFSLANLFRLIPSAGDEAVEE